MDKNNRLLTSVYIKALAPGIIGMLGGTINVLFDGILVGRRLGDLGLASVNQSMAVYLLLCTVGSLIAAGASAKSAEAMGDNRQKAGREYYCIAVELAILLGGILCLAGYVLSGSIAGILGSVESKDMVETYVQITLLGGVFKILLYIPFFYLRLAGKARQAAYAMVVMAGLNIILDYVFLFYFDWGIGGAAWASVIATATACIMGFVFLGGSKGAFPFHMTYISRDKLTEIVRSGSPMAANNLFSALRLICLNQIMNCVGGSEMVAIFGITNSINEFSISIQNGVPQAGSAMLGIYYGERDKEGIRKLLKLQLITGIVLSCSFAFAFIIGRNSVGVLFGSHLDISLPIICLAVSIVIGTVNSIMTYYYYAVMKPGMANLITVMRVFVLTVAAAWFMMPLENQIWMFYWAAECMTVIVWVLAGYLVSAGTKGKKDLYLLKPEQFDAGTWIHVTVSGDNESICEASEKIQNFCMESGFQQEQALTIGLALEELMVITAEKSLKNQGTMDVRIYKNGEEGILRIRSEGKNYNPLDYAQQESLEYLGVSMIMKMAKRTEYQSILGLNTLIVFV